MTAEDVVEVYSSLLSKGVRLWVAGGWGIDALLERQTRLHNDLDVIVALDRLPALCRVTCDRGFSLKGICPENRWAAHPETVALVGRQQPASEVATAFVLWDGLGRMVDIHVVRFGENGRGVPAWDTDFVFPATAFAGRGVIAKTPVLCLSAETQMLTHAGYVRPEEQAQDLRLLGERFGLRSPK